MKNKISLLALILCASALHAEDFTTLDGDKYTNATIKRVEPDGLVIADADGVRKLRFKKLAPEIGIKYGFDPAKAEAFKAAEIQAAVTAQAGVIQCAKAQKEKSIASAQTEAIRQEPAQEIHVTITSVIPEGIIADLMETEESSASRSMRRQGISGGQQLAGVNYGAMESVSWKRSGDEVFIPSVKNVAEGDVKVFQAHRVGEKQVHPDGQIKRTLPSWEIVL